MSEKDLKTSCCEVIDGILQKHKMVIMNQVETALFQVLAPEIKELSSERSISSSITKVLRNREWEESLKEQGKDRFVHWNFTMILLTADEGENKKQEQLKNEWMDMITKTAKENKLKAERLSKIWEKDIYSIRRSIQETVIPSGTRRIPKTLEDNDIFKI